MHRTKAVAPSKAELRFSAATTKHKRYFEIPPIRKTALAQRTIPDA
jgi:hypothetical protein